MKKQGSVLLLNEDLASLLSHGNPAPATLPHAPNSLQLEFFKNWGNTPCCTHHVLPGGKGQVTKSEA